MNDDIYIAGVREDERFTLLKKDMPTEFDEDYGIPDNSSSGDDADVISISGDSPDEEKSDKNSDEEESSDKNSDEEESRSANDEPSAGEKLKR